jgi:hypothetical protein
LAGRGSRSARGLTRDRFSPKIGPEAVSTGAGSEETAGGRRCASGPAPAARRGPLVGGVAMGVEQGNFRKEEEGRPVLARRRERVWRLRGYGAGGAPRQGAPATCGANARGFHDEDEVRRPMVRRGRLGALDSWPGMQELASRQARAWARGCLARRDPLPGRGIRRSQGDGGPHGVRRSTAETPKSIRRGKVGWTRGAGAHARATQRGDGGAPAVFIPFSLLRNCITPKSSN